MGLRGNGGRGLEDKEKGHNVMFGLWCFATDARDPMHDVMIRYASIDFEFCLYLSSKLSRLHSYIKQNQPYPDVYKYTPDRTPSTHAHAHAHPYSPLADGIDHIEQSTGSSLDALFSKMGGGSVLGVLLGGPWSSTSLPTPSQTLSKSLALLDSIFASTNMASPSPSLAWTYPHHPPAWHTPADPKHLHPNGILSPKPTNGAMEGCKFLPRK